MISSRRRATKLLDVIGPVVLSAFSLFIVFGLLQPVALTLDPSFSLLASRSVGKIAFTLAVIIHIFMIAALQPRSWWQQFVAINAGFIKSSRWLKPFFTIFGVFFSLHAALLVALAATPYASLNLPTLSETFHKLPGILLGFVATFFLAWTEEAIFRGTLIPLLKNSLSTIPSIFISALIFMLAHNVTAPWQLLTTDLALGTGLFLLGFMLAQLYVISGTLYVGMGAHAGLVFVKVILRRLPCVLYAAQLPWWVHPDLRQSPLVHLLFLAVICGLFVNFKGLFTKKA